MQFVTDAGNYVIITVCLSVCELDNVKSFGRIWIKFSGLIDYGTGTNGLQFEHPQPVMLILVLVLKDQIEVLVLVLASLVFVLVLVLVSLVLVLVLVLAGPVLDKSYSLI